jgi:hypothetical protein
VFRSFILIAGTMNLNRSGAFREYPRRRQELAHAQAKFLCHTTRRVCDAINSYKESNRHNSQDF